MSFPTQRLTITPKKYLLLRPGLDAVVNGLASAKRGAFPYRHPYHRVDYVATDIYQDQAYDDEMAARIINLREKVWELSQSRKTRLDAFQPAAAGFALRLWKAHGAVGAAHVKPAEIRLFQAKIEAFRKRAKRATIARLGKSEYQAATARWQRFVKWTRYNLLYFRLSKRGQPFRANLWRDQRRRLTEAINMVLAEHFYEAPNGQEMTRLVTLATTSLRRGRHSIGLRTLLAAPQEHSDFLMEFVVRRMDLKLLPGAPIPLWQQITDRADKFITCRERRDMPVSELPEGLEPARSNQEQRSQTVKAQQVAPIKPRSKSLMVVPNESLLDAMAQILSQIPAIGLSEQVVEQAKFQVRHHLDLYRRPTIARTLKGLVKELRPLEYSTCVSDLINQYVEWLLGLALALGWEPSLIYQALGAALFRAKQLEVGGHRVK